MGCAAPLADRARKENRRDGSIHLSVHTVEGDGREPPTAEHMERSWQGLRIVEAEMKSTGTWVFSGRLHDAQTATVVRIANGEVLMLEGDRIARLHGFI
jgi:hypothetical protein